MTAALDVDFGVCDRTTDSEGNVMTSGSTPVRVVHVCFNDQVTTL